MTVLDHEAYCAHITAQTGLLREALRSADLPTIVPTCPEWDLYELGRHVGGAHRMAEHLVRTRTTEPPSFGQMIGGEPPRDAEGLGNWLAEGAERLAATLREAGPDVEVWTFGPHRRSGFWARRMALETLLHHADGALAVGAPYQAPPELAADLLDEWLELISLPAAAEFKEDLKALRGQGETIHLHATDTDPALGAEWFITREPERPAWRRDHAKADVALRGPLTELMLAFMRRLPLDSERLEVVGDRALLEHWLANTSF